MTSPATILLVAAGVMAVSDWFAVFRDRRALEYVCKPATLVLLTGVALTLHPAISSRRGWFVLALVCCLVGDVLLMLPGDLFVPGLASFLAGHIAYIAGLSRHLVSSGRLWLAVAVLVIIGLILGGRILRGVRRASVTLTLPVAAYMVVISAMVATAVATGNGRAAAGAALFYVSDASIAWDKFVSPWSWARTWIMVTYHLGQAALVLSLTR